MYFIQPGGNSATGKAQVSRPRHPGSHIVELHVMAAINGEAGPDALGVLAARTNSQNTAPGPRCVSSDCLDGVGIHIERYHGTSRV